MAFASTFRHSLPVAAIAALTLTTLAPSRAQAEALLLVDASTGKVLHAENATYPWYPASVTKVMTAYVTLRAVKEGRLTLDTLLEVSARAAAQQPSKMGFKPGTKVTVDNALKMLMVKSANDIAVVLAEGVSETVEKFADEMNAASKRLGMTQSHWVNPNGLPAEEQISSARDLAILARAVYQELPEYEFYWHLPGIRLGKKVMRNHNTLIGRYSGADGMKTGFICASGFNLLATATRRGKRLIAVVLGAPSSPVRGVKAALLLERGFNSSGLNWLTPSLGTVNALPAIEAAPPDLRDPMCGPHRKRPAAEEVDDEQPATSVDNNTGEPGSPQTFMLSSLPPGGTKPSALLAPPGAFNAVTVFVGPPKTSADTQLATRAKTKTGKPQPALANAPAATVPATAAPIASPTGAMAVATPLAQPAPNAFGPAPGQFTPQGDRKTPATNDQNTRWMSFAPPARAGEVQPLTAAPAAKPTPKLAVVPMPRPRPKAPAATR